MLVPRPIAGDVRHARRPGAGDENTGDQQHQHGVDHRRQHFHLLIQQSQLLLLRQLHAHGLGGGGAVRIGDGLLLGRAHAHGQHIHHQHADHQHRRNPGKHIDQVHPAQRAQANAQHLKEELHPGLGQVLGGIITLAGLAVVVVVHELAEHVDSSCNRALPFNAATISTPWAY